MTKHKDEYRNGGHNGPATVNFHNEEVPPTRALIVHLSLRNAVSENSDQQRTVDADLAEITGLALAIELEIVETSIVSLRQVSPATYLGTGKVNEIEQLVATDDIELVVTNTQLSPGQQRNLEKIWNCKVLDRTGLILEIFGRRAQTREGRLQVELAHLAYQRSRLVRSWTHLERQRGGSGTVGGPGETQKESDRRALQTRMKKLEAQLEKVKKTRGLHRKSRQKVPFPVVALVGYTNAGKSTLFNYVTTGNVLAKDLLFATLDPTMRKLELPRGRKVILSDTVGFIADLPTQLVAAFRATLEEVLSADLIIHIRDIAHQDTEIQRVDVLKVLGDLGVTDKQRSQMVEVWNKSDLLDEEELLQRRNLLERTDNTIIISSLTGQGVNELLDVVELSLGKNDDILTFSLPLSQGADLAWVYEHGDVLERTDSKDGTMAQLSARFPSTRIEVARKKFETNNLN
ncbi:Ribosome LSU-associated GTP-binding protein HflX [hydrothermal vent metagenome]|uniref:Ribosome LSU-associated GTP-binding protein HflX n=1 Tax=hydrothermal vent metagenome TaxID=652676 RepID=A0A3B0RIS2_9ZZZZ